MRQLKYLTIMVRIWINATAACEDALLTCCCWNVQAFLHHKDVRFIFGARDVCQCNIPGYQNRPDACYHSGAQCSPNEHGGTIDGHTCCDTWPDTTSSNLCAHSCEAMLQGSNRLQRGINYVAYLRQLSGNAERPQMGFFDGGHNNSGFYASTLFISWAYH
jgi:hypothetical protein